MHFVRHLSPAALLTLCALAAACSSENEPAFPAPEASGAGGTGAMPSSGGMPNAASGSGGTLDTAGSSGATASGGQAGSGGLAGAGGSAGTASAAGGSSAETSGGTGNANAGSGTGGSASGNGGAGTGGSGGTPANERFTLAWQDDFDTIDPARWALQTFSWDGNLAQFSTENAHVNDGILSISLTSEPSDTAKPYRGVELRSLDTVTYGKVEARMRFARGSGVVSSLVLIYTPWPADDWNEIDIEHLGKDANTVQLNCMTYTGEPTTPPVTTSVTPTQDPEIVSPGFDVEADFHVYGIEWSPEDVRFTVDGVLLRTWTADIARMRLPQNILFTIWASSAPTWAGPLQPDSVPTSADVDWVKVYDLNE